jgi:hypothetical protein
MTGKRPSSLAVHGLLDVEDEGRPVSGTPETCRRVSRERGGGDQWPWLTQAAGVVPVRRSWAWLE